MQLLTQSKNNVSALELMRQLGVSYRSAWLMKHKIMEAMRLREDRRELTGRVEIDDAYLGGELSGGKAGRGSENKVPFVAAVQTTPSGQPVLACLRQQPHTEEEVAIFAASHIAPSATVVSDGLWCFAAGAKLVVSAPLVASHPDMAIGAYRPQPTAMAPRSTSLRDGPSSHTLSTLRPAAMYRFMSNSFGSPGTAGIADWDRRVVGGQSRVSRRCATLYIGSPARSA
jgi:hypothetical protein